MAIEDQDKTVTLKVVKGGSGGIGRMEQKLDGKWAPTLETFVEFLNLAQGDGLLVRINNEDALCFRNGSDTLRYEAENRNFSQAGIGELRAGSIWIPRRSPEASVLPLKS